MKSITIAAFALSLTLLCSGPLLAQSGNDLYQQALVKERAEGDVQGAIELYQRIAREFTEDRPLAAKALVQMGLCYEKLGLTEARQAYQQVIDGFPEQQGEVAVARERLALLAQALAELETGPTFRKIEIASRPQGGVLSPDGNQLAFSSEGALWAVPLHGRVDPDMAGEPVRLADVPGIWPSGGLQAWSADGKWIAGNYDPQQDDDAVHVYLVPAAGGEPRLVQMPQRGGGFWNYRLSLSPDGQQVTISAPDSASQDEPPESDHRFLFSTSTAGGELRRMASVRGEQGAYSPDGKLIAFVSPRGKRDWPEDVEREPPDLGIYDADFWVVPTAGGREIRLATVQGRLRGPVWSPDARFVALHHEPGPTMDSQEIWVYPMSPDGSSAGEPTKISLPGSSLNMLAGWTPDGELGVFIDSEFHLALYTAPASGGPAVQVASQGIFYYPRWSPDGKRIFLRRVHPDQGVSGVGMGYVDAEGGDVVDVPWPDGPLMSVVPGGGHNVSPDGKQIVVAAAEIPINREHGGDLWTIPVDVGSPIRLTNDPSPERYPCWSPDGQWVAFTDWLGTSEDEGFNAIYVVPSGGGEIRQISSEADSVGDGAIAFSPDGERITFFSGGAIKTIPIGGGRPEVLVAEVVSGRHSQLEWSPDGSKIAHNAGGKIWITSLDEGMPKELRTGLPENADLSEFGWSPDGDRIVFMATMGGEPEFWLISDFLPEGR